MQLDFHHGLLGLPVVRDLSCDRFIKKETHVRRIHVSALAIAVVVSWLTASSSQ